MRRSGLRPLSCRVAAAVSTEASLNTGQHVLGSERGFSHNPRLVLLQTAASASRLVFIHHKRPHKRVTTSLSEG